ncbi:MAG: ornithine carbamoyltransferase, partial [Candidatus Diapherotrites archaeon]|nr:ornithine carbamoyltransferase [Candidatus Diapherotrites archaeon]
MTKSSLSVDHLISIYDLEKKDIDKILKKAIDLKKKQKKGVKHEELYGKTLAMVFEKPSTRTRVSFETGMTQLGGHAINLSPRDIQLARGETIEDTGRVLSRYVDGVMARVNTHATLMHLARVSSVPVINGLSDFNHPCQVLSDLLTIKEHKGRLKDLKIAWVGDGNNVCHSLMYACGKLDLDLWMATPNYLRPEKGVRIEADKMSMAACELTMDPMEAVQDADVVYTDTWVSMGDAQAAR